MFQFEDRDCLHGYKKILKQQQTYIKHKDMEKLKAKAENDILGKH